MRQIVQPATVFLEEDLCIPAAVHVFEEFRRWSHSEQFPERGRIDFLQGDVEVDMSPEDLDTHAIVKVAISVRLAALVTTPRRGWIYVDSTRLSSPAAGLSAEPDIVVVLRDSFNSGRVRKLPAATPSAAGPASYVELEGAPDLIVEVVSKHSVKKDRERLPAVYARAGVGELWLADARGERPILEILTLAGGQFVRESASVAPGAPDAPELAEDAAGRVEAGPWAFSPLLGHRFRLCRQVTRSAEIFYELEAAQ
jgi:Uma2 family endonuclease